MISSFNFFPFTIPFWEKTFDPNNEQNNNTFLIAITFKLLKQNYNLYKLTNDNISSTR
jgi:hypothetical protein